MGKSVLLLPVGGSATRMIGLPKFMLPISETDSLIERHCRGALNAGYDEVHIITRRNYYGLLQSYFDDRSIPAMIHSLTVDTKTMTETLKFASSCVADLKNSSITVGLADTAFYGTSYSQIYGSLLQDDAEFALGLFVMREDQRGKLGQVNLDYSRRVLEMRDKDVNCTFPSIWGLVKVPGVLFDTLDILDQHIGIGLGKLVAEGREIVGVINESEYYDCGTFNEYLKFLTR
jgi:hypothetical protein